MVLRHCFALSVALAFTCLAAQNARAAASEWVAVAGGGVVEDEGNDAGSPISTYCDVECCKIHCDATANCNSFAAAAGKCFLKDKCVTASDRVGRSAYTTYYRTGRCPRSVSAVMTDAATANAALEAMNGKSSKTGLGARQSTAAAAAAAGAGKRRGPTSGSREYTYPPTAPFPSDVAGEPLPKLYMEPKSEAPFAALPKNVYDAHCKFLVDSQIKWIVVLGDSVARAFGVAMMEHLAGDDVHFCDAANGPPQVLGDKKYLNDKKYKEFRRQTCPAGFEIFKAGLNPEVNSPLEARVCDGKVRITTVEIWEYAHVDERLIPFIRGEALDFEVEGTPDLVVSSIFRSVRYVTRYQKYPGLVQWFKSLFEAAKNEGIRHIYVGMHERNMRRVPKVFHKTQNNTHCKLANQAAWEAAEATGTSMVDIFNITRNNELWTDTSDGTHVGWKANAIKVDRLIRAIPNARYIDDVRGTDVPSGAGHGHEEL